MMLATNIARSGPVPEDARAAVILLHGRGGGARDMLGLAATLNQSDVAWIAPEAPGNTWYPNSFLAPLDQNEPWLSRALATVATITGQIEALGLSRRRIALLGFSQGACLASEAAARMGGPWGGLIGLSGGLIGPPGTPRDYGTSLDGTPVFLGCSDVDPHVPRRRFEETAKVLRDLGGTVDARLYPGMGHLVNRDELAAVTLLLEGIGQVT